MVKLKIKDKGKEVDILFSDKCDFCGEFKECFVGSEVTELVVKVPILRYKHAAIVDARRHYNVGLFSRPHYRLDSDEVKGMYIQEDYTKDYIEEKKTFRGSICRDCITQLVKM